MPRIVISHYSFSFPDRYQPGHRLTPEEALALNQLLGENIRNNVDQWVGAAPAGILSVEDLEALQHRIADYAEGYQFSGRTAVYRPSGLERELAQVAGEKLTQTGLVPGDDGWEAGLTELEGDQEVQQEARKRLEVKRDVARASLVELGL